MLINKKITTDKDGSYIEAIFDSSNILKTIYFPHRNKLFIHFRRGHTYSYTNVTEEIYDEFEKAESQGTYFSDEIKNNPNYIYAKEFKLTQREIDEVDEIIKEWKSSKR